MTEARITLLVQSFQNFSFNVTVVKSNHEINLLTLFLSISHHTRPNLLYAFLSYHSVSYRSCLFHPAHFSLRTLFERGNLKNVLLRDSRRGVCLDLNWSVHKVFELLVSLFFNKGLNELYVQLWGIQSRYNLTCWTTSVFILMVLKRKYSPDRISRWLYYTTLD